MGIGLPGEVIRGGCTCGDVRYEVLTRPLFVHGCHCTWCQRESGSAFAINILIEASNVQVLSGQIEYVKVPTLRGKGQVFARCPRCKIAVWSHYSGMGREVSFVKGGTLDDPSWAPPDIHIYTSTKQDYVILSDDKPVRAGYYRKQDFWPEESLKRWSVLKRRS